MLVVDDLVVAGTGRTPGMRVRDADAAVYWRARGLEAGEDVDFVARRLVVFTREDVGNADLQRIADAVGQAAYRVGLPEAALP